MYRNAVYIVYFKLENKKLKDKSKLIMWAKCDLKSQLLQTLVAHFDLQLWAQNHVADFL